jgi:ribosomal protein S18 acetylase RimI-like enzyme
MRRPRHERDIAASWRCGSAILMVVHLRALSPDEWEWWREVRLRALADTPEAFGSTLAEWQAATEDRWRLRLSEVSFNVVAVVDAVTVGQVSGTHPDVDGHVELISLWVAPSARGLGVGDALVTAVIDEAHRAGARLVKLSVRRSNASAIALYERAGFEHKDRPGGGHDELTMQRRLPP